MPEPVQLTKTRVDALLALARRGEDDLFYYWMDNYGIDVTETDDVLVGRAIKASLVDNPNAFHEYEAWDAVQIIRQARAAQHVLGRRYA